MANLPRHERYCSPQTVRTAVLASGVLLVAAFASRLLLMLPRPAAIAIDVLSVVLVLAAGMLLERQRRRAEAVRQEAMDDLRRRSDELRNLTRGLSHDLKSPLFTITGFLQLLEADLAKGNDERVAKDLGTLKDVARRMQHLIEEMLDAARREYRAATWRELDVNEIVRDVVILLQGQVREHGVTVDVSGPLPPAHGDPGQIRGIFQNLIDNAVKFSAGAEAPRVEIGCRAANGLAVYYVADNGLGVAVEDKQKIFEPFNTSQAGRGGSGVGLASVKEAVEGHGGCVWVESEGSNRGSTFYFNLTAVYS